MARSVLTRRPSPRAITALALSGGLLFEAALAGCTAAAPDLCPRTLAPGEPLQKEYGELRQSVERGSLYAALVKRFGAAYSCSAKVEDRAVVLSYGFKGGASLVVKRDASIELSEQRVTASGLDRGRAVELLRYAERDAFSDGCGISWHAAPVSEPGVPPDGRDLVYRGDVCNCQGRVLMRGDTLVAIVFRSAC